MTEKILKTIILKLDENEMKIIRFWHNSCHLYNDDCPLHCIKAGTDFCHLVAEHISAETREQTEEKTYQMRQRLSENYALKSTGSK